MTSFLDVIRPLTEQLKSMSGSAKAASQTYTTGTTRFRNHTNDVGSLTSPIVFVGQGSDAFVNTVNHNADLSTKAITRFSDFQTACDDAKKTMEDLSTPYDNESRYLNNVDQVSDFSSADPYTTYEFQYFLDAQGYTTSDTSDPRTTVVRRIREDTLPGLSFQLDSLLNTSNGQALLESNIDYAVSCIKGDFQSYQSKRYEFLDGALRSKEISKDQHYYYHALVDSTYEIAMGVVNAIAKNMKTGYDSWDAELVAAANNFLTKIHDIDTGNLTQLQLYNTIDSRFQDPRSRTLLYAMLTSHYGAKVVQYLLNTADCSKMSPCGDALIVWQDGMPANTGAFNNGTVTTLNTQDFDPNDPSSLATLGGYLAHESAETYYSRAYDIPANTLPMDYLADYMHQIVTNQMLGNDIGSFPSYEKWVNAPQNPPDGSVSGYDYVNDFHESGDPGGGLGEHLDSGWWSLWNDPKPNFAGNPMGLSPSLLQNDSTLPGWDITKHWNSHTSSFHLPTPKPLPTPQPPPMPGPVPEPPRQPGPKPTPLPDPTPNPQPISNP